MAGPDHYAPAPARAREEKELTPVQVTICKRLMLGESVRKICLDEDMPSKTTVFEWLATDVEFRTAYQIAKQLLAETLAEDVIEISDDSGADYVQGEDGQTFVPEHVQRARLRVDSRKWLAGKLAPKRYGDSTALRLGGMDGLDNRARKMSTEDIAVRLAAIMHAAEKRKG
ncbi:hypothetical protein [Novosphingobium sp. CECT 9465]|uniref:terminase small subunit-like protein n=1 Tax=Novosphingobium sp. CECT 9465 TaxID=2829794 RepID=UPI001E4161FF|nr:hypothetical protein [Novosphingobium sp. CECT 9465]CAH0496614.1 hypothetical protein NVSP9465_01651 [Novosphingobium sp. CECT 9465]